MIIERIYFYDFNMDYYYHLILLVAVYIGIYNGLQKAKVHADEAWSQIDVQLKRRNDLIPNLVETVKGYAKHESGTLEK